MMKPERWAEVERLYDEIVDLDPAEREARLARIADDDLRHEVDSLIQAGPLPSDLSMLLSAEREWLLAQQAMATGAGQAAATAPGLASPPHAFAPGDLLASRYEIVAFLGQGGMGEVYEAHDRDLRERIALKVIRLETSLAPGWIDRFRREVQLARRITHPNVCRVFDIQRHRQGERETVFLTMELVRGETLAARLKRAGRLSTADALPIATQLCSALQAAHQAGILHRDLKCGNVMLVGCGEQVRAVVTDFGTARLMDSARSSLQTATQQSAILGTPAYMSPEQLEGKKLTPASDIYSLGLVLYEIVTGVRPFQAESPWAEGMRRLTEDPEPPFKIAPAVRENWNSSILRCLERNPVKRFSFPQEVLDALQESSGLDRGRNLVPVAVGGVQVRFKPRDKKWVWGIIAVMAPALALLFLMLFRAHPARALTAKDVVVLADFTNNTGEEVFDGTLKDGLAVALEQSPLVNILSDVKVAQTLKLMGRSSHERLTPEVAREICLRSNSQGLIAGSIARLGSHYAITLKATNCQTGDLLGAAEGEADSRENTLQALGKAAGGLRSGVGESLASLRKFNRPLPEVTTSSLEALQAYSEGSKLGAEKGDVEAIPFLERAVKLDRNFALAYSGLGMAYSSLRQHGLAVENMRRAYELRERVSEREGYAISGEYYLWGTRELLKAIQQYQLLIQQYPNAASAHGELGYLYTLLGKYEDAAREIREDLRLDPAATYVYSSLSYVDIALNRLDEAQAILAQSVSQTPEDPLVHYFLYMLAFVRKDEGAMQRQATWAKGKPGTEGLLLGLESAGQAFHGRLRKALESDHQALLADNRDLSKEAAAEVEAMDAIRFADFGYRRQSLKAARKALMHGASALTNLTSLPGNSFAVATLALARSGDTAAALSAAKTLIQKAPLDTLVQNFWLPTIQAEIEIKNGHPAKAIELLQATTPYDLNDVGARASVYTRGRAYLALHKGAAAAQDFQKMLDQNQLTWIVFPRALAYLGLARSRVLQAHSTTGSAAEAAKAQARAAYEQFFSLWKDADPGIPILHQAKAEYASLTRGVAPPL